MSADVLELHGGEPEPRRSKAKVFVRVITAPAGAPWEQGRAADLDARLGAPLPLSQVIYRVKRLEGWAPGRPARFAAFYVRTDEAAGELPSEVVVDGRPVRVSFQSPAQVAKAAQGVMLVGATAAAAVLLLGVFIPQAMAARSETEAGVASVEQRLAAKQSAIAARERLAGDAEVLARARGEALTMRAFLDDLTWVSSAKAPDARIQALYWDRGYLAVEARGQTSPFAAATRPVTRSEKPVRKGVWLWGVSGSRGPARAQSAPPAAVAGEAAR